MTKRDVAVEAVMLILLAFIVCGLIWWWAP